MIFNDYLSAHPLLKFSVYSHIQVEFLLDMGLDISKKVETTADFNKTYGSIWLWILGSYEVLRTMKEAEACLDSKLVTKLKELEKKFTQIRIPLAKQQYKNDKNKGMKQSYIEGDELSIAHFGEGDFGFTIDGEKMMFKELFSEFKAFISSIKSDDILQKIEKSKKHH